MQFVIHTSGITYLSLQMIFSIFDFGAAALRSEAYNHDALEVWGKLLSNDEIPMFEVLAASVLSVFVGLASTKVVNGKIIFLFAQKVGITNKFGDENLYFDFLRGDDVSDIYLKDFENNITYHGYVNSYSESENVREILLTDVDVYSYEDSVYLYTLSKVFISKKIDEIWLIELPPLEKSKQKQ